MTPLTPSTRRGSLYWSGAPFSLLYSVCKLIPMVHMCFCTSLLTPARPLTILAIYIPPQFDYSVLHKAAQCVLEHPSAPSILIGDFNNICFSSPDRFTRPVSSQPLPASDTSTAFAPLMSSLGFTDARRYLHPDLLQYSCDSSCYTSL